MNEHRFVYNASFNYTCQEGYGLNNTIEDKSLRSVMCRGNGSFDHIDACVIVGT